MCYIQGYQHDIFVSYAHVDNQPLEGMDKGWTTTLIGNLKNLLARKLGTRDFSLWMDRELPGHAPLTPAIMEALRQTATLIVIVSPAYLNSEWCSSERETFLKLVHEQSRSKSCVFVVEIDKIDRGELPSEFSDLLGYRFWVQDREGRAARTLAMPNPKPEELDYWDRLRDLSSDLADELKKLKENSRIQSGADTLNEITPNSSTRPAPTTSSVTLTVTGELEEFTAEEQKSLIFALSRLLGVSSTQIVISAIKPGGSILVTLKMPEETASWIVSMYTHNAPALRELGITKVEFWPTVFLAETTEDLDSEREEVKAYLKQAGLKVLPESYYPRDNPDAFKGMLEKDLAQCKLFVQLLSGIAGRKPAGLAQGYPGLQHDCAVQANKVLLQWRSRDLDVDQVKDSDYRRLLEGNTVRATGLEEFKREVVEEAFRPSPDPSPPPLGILVYMDADSPDYELAEKIGQQLQELNNDIDYAMPLKAGEPEQIRKDLEKRLSTCHAVITYYCSSSVEWVRDQLTYDRGILKQRKTPPKRWVVFEGPPPEPPKVDHGMRFVDLKTVRCHTGLDDTTLRDFVESLRG